MHIAPAKKKFHVRLYISSATFPSILHVVRCALKAAIASSNHGEPCFGRTMNLISLKV